LPSSEPRKIKYRISIMSSGFKPASPFNTLSICAFVTKVAVSLQPLERSPVLSDSR
jgi:hypothetical protein